MYNASADLDLSTTAGRTSEVVRIMHKLNTTNSARVLEALGHPGYGKAFAGKALVIWQANPGMSLHQVVYGTVR